MSTQDVVLAIAWASPGLGPTAIRNHDLWSRGAAPRPVPDASNISRAGKVLDEKRGELTRDGGFRVTEKGAERAKALHAALAGVAPEEQDAEAGE